jgi:hypothetical protein
MHARNRFAVVVVTALCCFTSVSTANAQVVDDITGFVKLGGTAVDIPGTTLNITNEYPNALIIEELNMDAIGFNFVNNPLEDEGIDPDGDGDIGTTIFERNSHIFYFQRNNSSFVFNRHEALDLSFNFQMDATHATPRKEAGFFFDLGGGGSQQAQFIATSNDELFGTGPGEITAFAGIPFYNFSSAPADYNDNGATDAADYTIWRDTLGTMDDGVDPPEDMRANGDNEGASQDLIDQADYDIWKENYGAQGINFGLGQSIFMRLIYSPPVTDPLIPFDPGDPGANVLEPGTMEYIISVNDGPQTTSGALDFANDHQGFPDGTFIGARVQYQGFPNNAPFPPREVDSARVSFTNFDLNGPDPGIGVVAGVPEPHAMGLVAIGAGLVVLCRGRRRSHGLV